MGKGQVGKGGPCAGDTKAKGASRSHHKWRDTLSLRSQFQAACQQLYCWQLHPNGWAGPRPSWELWDKVRNCLVTASRGHRKVNGKWTAAAPHKPPLPTVPGGSRDLPPALKLAVAQALTWPVWKHAKSSGATMGLSSTAVCIEGQQGVEAGDVWRGTRALTVMTNCLYWFYRLHEATGGFSESQWNSPIWLVFRNTMVLTDIGHGR